MTLQNEKFFYYLYRSMFITCFSYFTILLFPTAYVPYFNNTIFCQKKKAISVKMSFLFFDVGARPQTVSHPTLASLV